MQEAQERPAAGPRELVLHDDPAVDPAALVAVALARPGVLAVGTGRLMEPRTLFPGGDVRGLRIGAHRVEVHLRLAWPGDLAAVADDVRRTLLPLVGGRAVDVVVADIGPDPTPPHPPSQEAPA